MASSLEINDPNLIAELDKAEQEYSNSAVEISDPNLISQLDKLEQSSSQPVSEEVKRYDPLDMQVVGKSDRIDLSLPTAVVSGLGNFGADVGESVVNAGTWSLDKLGIIDPKTKKDIDNYIKQGANTLRVTPNEDGDVFEKAAAKHPYVAQGTKYAGDALALIKSVPGKIAGIGTLGNVAARAGTSALVSAGISGPETPDQDLAAGVGAGLSLATDAFVGGIGKLAKTPIVLNQFKKMVGKIQKDVVKDGFMSLDDKAGASIANYANTAKEVENNNWSQLKSIKGPINLSTITQNATQLSQTPGLMPEQSSKIQDLVSNLSNTKSMEDLIKMKQTLGQYFPAFSGKAATDTIYNKFKILQNSVNAEIASKASAAGMKGLFDKANQFHKDVVEPLYGNGGFDIATAFSNKANDPSTYASLINNVLNNGLKSPEALKSSLSKMDDVGSQLIQDKIVSNIFSQLLDSPEQFNKNKAMYKLNSYLTKLKPALSKETISKLKGVRKLLALTGAVSKTAAEKGTMTTQLLGGGTTGGAIGGSLGMALGGPVGAGIGAGIGSAVGFKATLPVLHKIHDFINSPNGLRILQGIGEGKPWVRQVQQVLIQAPAAGIAISK